MKAYASNLISELLAKGQACPTSSGPSRSEWAETLQMHGFLYKHEETSKGHNFNCKVWVKMSDQISSFDPFYVPMPM